MSDLQHDPSTRHSPHNALVPAEHHERESRTMLAIVMTGIAALFVLSVAMAVSQISHGVKTAASGKLPVSTSAPSTTGSGHGS